MCAWQMKLRITCDWDGIMQTASASLSCIARRRAAFSLLRGGTQLADCLQNNLNSSLVYFSTSLARLFRGCSCIRCCLYLVHRHATPGPKGPFLESLLLVNVQESDCQRGTINSVYMTLLILETICSARTVNWFARCSSKSSIICRRFLT
jgi:hypothetical protein